jgi:protoheme IX farnesyltransferase
MANATTGIETTPSLRGLGSGAFASAVRDIVGLGKPRITMLVLCTTAVGLWLAPTAPPLPRTLLFLLGTALLVASANTLNCWVERESDARMRRTKNRPLPSGRLRPEIALAVGLFEGALALGLVFATTNGLTTVLGAIALLSYVALYTPLKRVSWLAVLVGAVPGALPPLMGWTASTGTLAAPGWLLFGILFLWQLPHFIAISLYLKDDYARGGLKVLPLVHGDAGARLHLFVYTILLVAFSLIALPLGIAGTAYLLAAIALGAMFLYLAARGLRPVVESGWARRTFAYSLIYLPLLIVVLVIDAR